MPKFNLFMNDTPEINTKHFFDKYLLSVFRKILLHIYSEVMKAVNSSKIFVAYKKTTFDSGTFPFYTSGKPTWQIILSSRRLNVLSTLRNVLYKAKDYLSQIWFLECLFSWRDFTPHSTSRNYLRSKLPSINVKEFGWMPTKCRLNNLL